jgi:hypothetical protein
MHRDIYGAAAATFDPHTINNPMPSVLWRSLASAPESATVRKVTAANLCRAGSITAKENVMWTAELHGPLP